MSDRDHTGDGGELDAAVERWWARLDDAQRAAAERVVRGGGYLTAEMALVLVDAGVPILMPDDVRAWVKQQTAGDPPAPIARGRASPQAPRRPRP